MNKIQIVNWLLTRTCNLHCEYCRIVTNYNNQPKEYPTISHYIKNEMSTETVIEGLRRLKLHNPNVFNIFYGGEPLLRQDLYKIINYCNENEIHYTIISNNTEKVQPLMTKLFNRVSSIEGFTASIDPIIYQNKTGDIFKKSMSGFLKLQEYSSIINDVVAEITVTNENLHHLYSLVKDLTDKGINSDITFVDISKSPYYDFSNVTDDSVLVKKSPELRDIINSIIDEKLNVHMRDTLLPKIYDTLPSEYDCKLDENFHNMTIDADGTVRLCLRIRGVATPNNFNINNIIDDNGNLNEYLKDSISYDKKNYCQKCQWSCPIMSEMVSEEVENSNNLIHEEIRNR
jgi:radical SAM protein with 4Fe4S-binding SPASM domain